MTANNSAEPVAGGIVNFTVDPAFGGASATLSGATATIGANGIAQVERHGQRHGRELYRDRIDRRRDDGRLSASPTCIHSFSGVSDQSIPYGTSNVTVTGTLADGSEIPVGGMVTITLDGDEQQPTIDSNGDFSAIFDTSSLTVTRLAVYHQFLVAATERSTPPRQPVR